MVVSLNLNLSCAQPGEVDFPNLTTARLFLTLVESFAGFDEVFTAPGRVSRSTPPAAASPLQIARVEPLGEPAVNRSQQFARLLHLALVAREACRPASIQRFTHGSCRQLFIDQMFF